MKFFRKILLVTLLPVVGASCGYAQFVDQLFNYDISYKWGFIDKTAATAKLSLTTDGVHNIAQLSGETMSWINDFFCVRDTLHGIIEPETCLPLQYIKSTHQGSEYAHDVVRYERNGNTTVGYAKRMKQHQGQELIVSDTVLYATGPTFDLLSVFYYVRTLNYDQMHPGEQIHVNIFSGWTCEQLCITYEGEETINFDNRDWRTYKLRFTFTMDGKSCADPMLVWLGHDEYKIPIKLEGVLSFGSVQAYFQN